MRLSGLLLSWLLRLPPAETHDVDVKRNLRIPMPDGAVLLADLYTPRGGPKQPTILIRSPYGRKSLFSPSLALPFAQRGFQVLCQSTRGTAGSGGQFIYARHEHEDGLATIAWIKQQDWFSGELAMWGASYLGFVQWAVAADAGPELKALATAVTTSDFNNFRYQEGTLTLETLLLWSTVMTTTAASGPTLRATLGQTRHQRLLDQAFNHLPLKEADQLVVGGPSGTFQDTLAHQPEDPYWEQVDFSHTLPDVHAPVSMVAGWYDLFLYWQLEDYRRLRQAGKQPYLLIGPWVHGQLSSMGASIKEALDWLGAYLKGDGSRLRKDPVRLFVMGSDRWREFPDWPPQAREEAWYLQPEGGLAKDLPPASTPDRYRYNPADPTPAVGGTSLGKSHGQKDQRVLQARRDVLVYTGPILERDLGVIGPVRAELYVRSSLEHTDFFATLCVVKKSGKSINLCDGIVRLKPGSERATRQEDGTLYLELDLWPTAYHFRRGERIRVSVSSGAHPRFARNPGSGEPIGEETILCLAEQEVFHDPRHPSSIVLPILST